MNNTAPKIIRIKASAGSGKTYQLAIRYLTLLKQLKTPSPQNLRKIVAITFTNKAAWEMKDRIIRFLKEIALNTYWGKKLAKQTGLTRSEANQWLDIIILNYSDFYVRTIDSLLFAILKGLCFQLNLKPDLTVTFDERKLYDTAFDKLLASLSDNEKLLEKVLDTYLEIDEKGGFYPESGLKKRLFELSQKSNERLCVTEIGSVVTLEEEVKKLQNKLINKILEVKNSIKKTLIKNIENLSIEDLVKRPIVTKDINDIFLKKSNVQEREKQQLEEIRKKFLDKANKLLVLKAKARVSGYVDALNELNDIVDKTCKKEGIAPGSNWWTKTILEEIKKEGVPPLIYAHFGSRFLHFLFDEFQDTSRKQWEALYPLLEESVASGGSVFFVGDIKQAIYRWRGGDWNLFNEVFNNKNYFWSVSKENFKEEILKNNYRSSAELVYFFNDIFSPLEDKDFIKNNLADSILGKDTDLTIKEKFSQAIEDAYSNIEQIPVKKDTDQTKIKIFKIDGTKDEIIEKIKKHFTKNVKKEFEVQQNKGKPDIAVLVRSHTTGEMISSWLIEEGIPVITENALRLKVSNIVKGILCFLWYLYDQRDESALYGVYASGILNFGPNSEQELISEIMQGNLDALREKINSVSCKLKTLINRKTPYELIQLILERFDLSYRLENELVAHKPFVERLLEVTHYYEIEHGPGLSNYLNFWETGGLEEQVGLPENIDAVRVITIHKAKGLEYSTVFIPFTDWFIRDRTPVIVEDGALIQLTSKLPDEWQKKRQKLIAEEAQELINLFYVAVTRAKESLYLYLNLGQRGAKPVSEWIYNLLKEQDLKWEIEQLT